MEIKTTEKIIESVHVKDTIYLDKMEYDRLRDVKWVRVDDIVCSLKHIRYQILMNISSEQFINSPIISEIDKHLEILKGD